MVTHFLHPLIDAVSENKHSITIVFKEQRMTDVRRENMLSKVAPFLRHVVETHYKGLYLLRVGPV